MSCDDVQSLNRIFRDLVKVTRQSFQQHLEADHRHPLQGHLERLILPLPRQSHLQIHLTDATQVKRSPPVKHRNVNASSNHLFSLNTEETNPVSSNWQWVCCVHVLLPIITGLSVSKDLHLEVPHHGVHHFPGGQEGQDE